MANVLRFTLIFICINIHLSEQQFNSLRSLIIVHRHGDRTPLHPFPNDPYTNASFWPDGFGQLTNAGKLRMFELGKYFRNRYASFLTDDPLEVSAKSSDAERCINSAQLLLAGLYPPKDHWIWNKDIDWQPIAIHSLPMNIDGMLHALAPCPMWNQVNEMVQKSPEYVKYATQFKTLFDYLTAKSGTKITSLKSASLLNEILTEEVECGLKMPGWVTTSVLETLDQISAKNHIFETVTRLQVRLRAGMLFDEITRIMQQRGEKRRLFIYSTHDTKLAAMLSAMRVFNGLNIPYSASIVFEVYAQRTFKLLYLNDTQRMTSPIELKIAACAELDHCPVERLIETVQDLLGLEWQRECRLNEDTTHSIKSVVSNLMIVFMMKVGDVSKLIGYAMIAIVATTASIACLLLYLHPLSLHSSKETRVK